MQKVAEKIIAAAWPVLDYLSLSLHVFVVVERERSEVFPCKLSIFAERRGRDWRAALLARNLPANGIFCWHRYNFCGVADSDGRQVSRVQHSTKAFLDEKVGK